MKWNNKTKEIIGYIFAAIALIFGLALCVCGFIVDPTGIVDTSVLWVLGQCLAFVGAVCGFSLHINNSIQEIKSDILNSIKNQK